MRRKRPKAPVELAVLLAGLIGILQIFAALLRIGQVTQFISRSVTIAYSSATGVLLVVTQLPSLFGLERNRGQPMWQQMWTAAQQIATLDFDFAEPLVGGATLALYLLIRAVRPRWPDVLIGLTFVTLAFSFIPQLGALRVRTLADQGALAAALPGYSGVPFSLDDLPVLRTILSTALAISLLGMIEAVSIAKTLSIRHGEHIDANREILAHGAGNLANAFFGTIPGSASFVRSAVNAQSEACTQVAGLIAAFFLLVAVLIFSPFLNNIPIPALALRKASNPTLTEYTFNDSDQLTQLGAKAVRPHPQIAIIHVEGELFFGADHVFPSEENPNLATKKALLHAQHLLQTTKADVRIYYDRPPPAAQQPPSA